MHPRVEFARIVRNLALLLCMVSLTFLCNLSRGIAQKDTIPADQDKVRKDNTDKQDDNKIIVEHADDWEYNEQTGVMLLVGNVRILNTDGFLNADKVTVYRDVETDQTTNTVAEGHVEMKEGQVLATSDHANLNHVDDTVHLRGSVVVVQNSDRLEAEQATFNRRTGQQTAKGNPVKITRPDGFLNANQVDIYKDIETDEILQIVSEGDVELRDKEMFATSDHAILNEKDETMVLRENVVVIRGEDRLEADHYTFDRRARKHTGKGDVKFEFRIRTENEPAENTSAVQNSGEEK